MLENKLSTISTSWGIQMKKVSEAQASLDVDLLEKDY